MAHEDDRAVLRVDDHPCRGGVTLQGQGGVLHHGDVEAVLGEQVVDRLPPRAVHDARDQELTWTQIGELLGTTAATAARRYRNKP